MVSPKSPNFLLAVVMVGIIAKTRKQKNTLSLVPCSVDKLCDGPSWFPYEVWKPKGLKPKI